MMCRLGSAALHIPGMVMNLLPLRIGMQPDMSVGELVKQISAEMMKLRRHQHYRHEELRRELKLLGENQRLFGPQLNLMPFEQRLNFAGCQGIVHNLATGPVDDLSINIYGRPDGGGLKINMDANPAVYHADELEHHIHRFLTLLKTIADCEQTQPVGTLDILLPEERAQILIEWNQTDRGLPNESLTQRFEMMAKEYPESPAVVSNDEVLTYSELNKRANQLAHLLINKGRNPRHSLLWPCRAQRK